MNEPRRCPACGAILLTNRLAGLCPACTWRGLSESDDEEALVPRPAGLLMQVPGHDIISEVARGGMGIVYRARQLEPPRTVALKMLLPHQLGSAGMAERFRLEVQALTELEHPAILPVYQVGEHDRLPFFTMKLATGGTLAQRKMEFAGNWRAIAELLATLADAVQFAHEHGVLHRDLKPGNILFDEQGRAYVSDFGLAKLVNADSDLTRSVDFLGTPHYVAPEVAASSAQRATTASDIYGLGAILYELLAGRPPFEAEGVPALLKKIAEEEPALPSRKERGLQPASPHDGNSRAGSEAARLATVKRPEGRAPVPRDLEVICLKCLAKQPSARYGSAREFAEDLRRWLSGRTIIARPAGPAERAWSWAQRNPALAALSALLLFGLTVAALLQSRANRNLRSALSHARIAQSAARENLRQTLIAQARAQRQSGRLGQRYDALASIIQATEIRPSLEARTEAAAALATTDVKFLPRLHIFLANAESTVDFSPDLARYVTGRADGGFHLRSAADGTALSTYGTNQSLPAHQLRLSTGGRFACATYLNGSAEVWSLEPARRVWRREPGEAQPITPAFAPRDGGFCFALTNGTVLWQSLVSDAERVRAPPGLEVLGLSFGPAGKTFAVMRESMLEMRDVVTGELRWSLAGKFSTPEPAWSPDGERVAVGSAADNEVIIVNAGTGVVERRLQSDAQKPIRLAFHPDGRLLASVGIDRVLRFWDTRTGNVRWQTGAAPRVLCFSKDGRRIALAPSHLAVALAELAPENVWRELDALPSRSTLSRWLDISADGRLAATCDTEEIRLWDTHAGGQVLSLPAPGRSFASVFFHVDGGSLVYSGAGKGVFRRELRQRRDATDGFLHVQVGREEPLARDREGLLSSLGAGGRQWLIERRFDKQIVLWPDGQPERERALLSGARFNGAALSPDGRWLATLTAPLPGVAIWETASATLHTNLVLEGHADCRFSPDGRWLLVGTSKAYSLWEAGTWRQSTNWPASLTGKAHGAIFFSPAGDVVAVQQDRDSLQLCDTRDYHEIITLETPRPIDIASVAWSPDGQRIYLLGSGQRLYEWNLTKLRQELAQLRLDW